MAVDFAMLCRRDPNDTLGFSRAWVRWQGACEPSAGEALVSTTPSPRFSILFSSLALAALLLSVCTNTTRAPSSPENTALPTGDLIGSTGCKSSSLAPSDSGVPPDKDCIEYTYRPDSTLFLKHVNAAFNCCPGALFAGLEFRDSVIIIEEHEAAALCDCNCLYDLEYAIRHLSPGVYGIKVIEPYIDESEEPLEFVIDLRIPASGIYCVERHFYPWNVN
jgi:hypothetical protein